VKLLFSSVLLGLAWFALLNMLASMAAWALADAVLRRNVRPATLLAVRLMPALMSATFVVAVFLPAHLRFEPAARDESFGFLLGSLAALGCVLLFRSLCRALSAAWNDYRLGAFARRAAVRLDAGALEVRGFPGVSLAGILRPTILVGSDTVAALTAAELDAAISHEQAHRRSRDNFKCFLMFCAPDVFGWSAKARQIEDRWRAEAECQADARAVAGDDRRALVLASALVKVARLTKRSTVVMPSPAWSALHLAALLETRVRLLTAGRAPADAGNGRLWRGLVLAAIGVATTAWLSDGSYALHQITESMVTHLP
jgi:beta-lactamase regulating signal transducer with metallopeptidase domain